MTKIWRDKDNNVINLGEWDERLRAREVVAERRTVIGHRAVLDEDGRPIPGPDGKPVTEPVIVERGEIYVPDPNDMVADNPIPDDATMIEDEIVERADGGLAAASDYVSLRRVAYPSIADQLDALGKGGEAWADMVAALAAVKARYPKPGSAVNGVAVDAKH